MLRCLPRVTACLRPGRRGAASVPGPSNSEEYFSHGSPQHMDAHVKNLWKAYGDVYMVPPGLMSTGAALQFLHPRDIEVVLRNEGKNPVGLASQLFPFSHFFKKNKIESSLGLSQGEEWRRLRAALQKRIFSPRDVVDYLPILNPVIADLAAALPRHAREVNPHLSNATFDMMNTVLFGTPLGVGGTNSDNADPENKEYVNGANRVLVDLMDILGNPAAIESFMKDPDTCKEYLKFEEGFKGVMARGKKLLDKCMTNLGREGTPEFDAASRSYIAQLIKAGEMDNEEAVVTNVLGLLSAGVDTTATTMEWLLLLLATNPEQQSELRSLVRSSFGSSKGESLPMTAERWKSSPFLKWAVKETFRLHPPIIGTQRITQHDFSVRDIDIPSGSIVAVSTLPYLRDERVWGEDANAFRISRWDRSERGPTEPDTDPRAPNPSWRYDPFMALHFSRGPRMCVGARLAELNMAGWLAEVVQRYQIRLADDSPSKEEIKADFSTTLGRPMPKPMYLIEPATD